MYIREKGSNLSREMMILRKKRRGAERIPYGTTYRSTVCRSPVAPAAPCTVPTGSRTTTVCARASSGCRSAACKSDRCFRRPRVAEFRPPRCWIASAPCHRPRSALRQRMIGIHIYTIVRSSCSLIDTITLMMKREMIGREGPYIFMYEPCLKSIRL